MFTFKVGIETLRLNDIIAVQIVFKKATPYYF